MNERIQQLIVAAVRKVPVSVRLFVEVASKSSKEKAAFLFLVLLPLAFGIFKIAAIYTIGCAVLLFVRKADLQVALLTGLSKPRLVELLRQAGRNEEALTIRGINEYEKVLCLRAAAKEQAILGDRTAAIRSLNAAYESIAKNSLLVKANTDPEIKDKAKVVEIADTLNDLAGLLQETDSFDAQRVESLLEEAVKAGRASVKRENPMVTVWLMNLGIYKQQKMHKFDESLALYKEVLEIRKETLGEEDPLVAKWLSEMAYLLLSRPDAAQIGDQIEQLTQEALKIRRKIYGDDHVDVASSLNDCALMTALAARDGDDAALERARQYGKESADTYERVLGKSHPMAVKARSDWGS